MTILLVVLLIAILAVGFVHSGKPEPAVLAFFEWFFLLVATVVIVYFILKGFGFISTNDIQAYPN